jgi:GT2 family glycosyltransferase
LSPPSVTVVIPTLAADAALTECLRSLECQSIQDFEVVVVDNSGQGSAHALLPPASSVRVIENCSNVGFGAAINLGIESSQSEFVATLNDDAVAHAGWIEALLRAAADRPDAGMYASQVRLQDTDRLDSTGMLIAGDASSKQRGHGEPSSDYSRSGEALFPSGSAALFRRTMLNQIGGFDADFFLYCEDTDVGLRGIWAGWKCLYVADAVVEHRYSHSAGRASALKAYFVERNRLFVAVKNFPFLMLVKALFVSVARYAWHLVYMLRGRGKAAEFAEGGAGPMLAWFVVRAHWATLTSLPTLLRKRRNVQSKARIDASEFTSILRRHWITARQVAAH